jgi:putative FmdB family regulatory protein
MPIYEYRCSTCGSEHEALQKLSDPPLATCPSCLSTTLTKLMSAASFQLKGSGWYATDFKNGSKPATKTEANAETKTDGNSETKTDGDSKTKGEGNSETKTSDKSEAKSDGKSETKTGSTTTSESSSSDSKSVVSTPAASGTK